MFHRLNQAGRSRKNHRRALTLVELLSAMTIMVMVSAALLALATTVESGATHSQGLEEATQHARVVIDRIQRSLNAAYANEHFPGFAVIEKQVGRSSFPGVLVVWNPTGEPANPDGMPLWRESVIYYASDNDPHQLLEIRMTSNSGTVPPLDDIASWESELAMAFSSYGQETVVLTNLLRVGNGGSSPSGPYFSGIRFHVAYRPSETQWQSYQDGTTDWHDLPWVQGIYGSQTGMRQSWCRFEIQLLQGQEAKDEDPTSDTAIPYFGSAAVYYPLKRNAAR